MNKRTISSENIKIIAIRARPNCHQDYVKVLQKNRIYTFYKDYLIDEITEDITFTPSIPQKLFDKDGLSINVSAIAGPNGSGKSTLIELMFLALNNIGYVNGLHDELQLVTDLDVELYCLIDDLLKIRVCNDEITVFKYDHNYKLIHSSQTAFDLNTFFFTIALNYSLYSYNSLEIRDGQKDWLKGLFHKNDSYQTPLVINPWRNKGNIDINNENGLVRLRLMANLLRPTSARQGDSFRRITENLTAIKLRLTLNKGKSDQVLYEIPGISKTESKRITLKDLPNIDKHRILSKLNKIYPFGYRKNNWDFGDLPTDYLIGKLISVAVTYGEYRLHEYYSVNDGNFDMEKIDKFLSDIIDDSSHIAFKVKQTLNFLKYRHIDFFNTDIGIEDLSNRIDDIIRKNKRKKLKIEELIPPPLFRVDILLANDENAQNEGYIYFQTLSSGERQVIYSISSLVYHLINLDSVTRRGGKVKYKYINIVLEEIELYFHPEMQRGFLQRLLNNICKIDLQSIKGINFCFVTHSPFILSDIPNANVMFLKVENKVSKIVNKEEKTFGANIHDLLSDGFFMYNGLVGEFALNKINETIRFLEYTNLKLRYVEKLEQIRSRNNSNIDTILFKKLQKEEMELEELFKTFTEKDRWEHLKLIKIIGEPVLSVKLLEMYSEVFPADRKDMLMEQIEYLNNELNKLNQ